MPIYEFMCLDCGNEFEKLQTFSDTSTPTCPRCQSTRVQRRLSAPAVHFKGSGWYVTDSKNGAKSTTEGKTKEEKVTSEKNNSEKSNPEKNSSEKSSPEKSKPEKSETTKTNESAGSAVKEPA